MSRVALLMGIAALALAILGFATAVVMAQEQWLCRYDFTTGISIGPTLQLKNGATIVRDGEGRNVLRLDGIDDYAEIPDSSGWHVDDGITFYAVVKFAECAGDNPGRDDNHDMLLFKNDEYLFGRSLDALYFNHYDGSNWITGTTGGKGKLRANTWVHVAATMERTMIQGVPGYLTRLFLNGKMVSRGEFPGFVPIEKGTLVTLGRGWGGPWYFKGDIAEVGMLNRAMTEGEIKRVFDESWVSGAELSLML